MNTKFKRHQEVKILRIPNKEYVEYHNEEDETKTKEVEIKKGMSGKVNLILPNGKYHVEILNDKGKIIAYAPFEEEDLE